MDSRWFQVEPMPCDHSCGFHGLGISREEAAAALLRHRGDAEVVEFVAADLVAALQTGDRKSFPREIREDEELWRALASYYAAQQGLDQGRREGRELLAEDDGGGVQAANAAVERAGGDVTEAVLALCSELKSRASSMQSSSAKTGLMQRLGRCKTQAKSMGAAIQENVLADQALRKRCAARFDEYVGWVGSDRSFWLSFVRGCGSERTGGLLDALAKVHRLTVCVWSEGPPGLSPGAVHKEPDLELVHEATFGGRVVHLWYQGDRGHFDRLVPCSGKSVVR